MMNLSNILVGYDYDAWYGYGEKKKILIDVSPKVNSHILVSGISGSGKSWFIEQLIARIFAQNTLGEVFFADYKQDDTFEFLRMLPRYYAYESCIDALETVYKILHKRQSGEDKTRNPITLVWDEYFSFILALQGTDKKKAEGVMRKISEILMLGRSLSVRLVIACQRPDASAFPSGSRINFGVVVVIGASIKSIYEMLIPKEYIEDIGDRKFKTGEGIVLLQGAKIYYFKVPLIKNMKELNEICIEALTK